MAKLRVLIFLSELDFEFDQVRGEISQKDPKLNFESIYACVRREYQQRRTMGSYRPISENLAMLANQTQQGSSSGSSKNRNNQLSGKANNLICTHCREKSHSQQRCY
ncbi:hypothetical protein ACOSQ2_006615 [Xanthoceras sorbifolium]